MSSPINLFTSLLMSSLSEEVSDAAFNGDTTWRKKCDL